MIRGMIATVNILWLNVPKEQTPPHTMFFLKILKQKNATTELFPLFILEESKRNVSIFNHQFKTPHHEKYVLR
jgi:hypothetical protein